jgi:hypothetical protein
LRLERDAGELLNRKALMVAAQRPVFSCRLAAVANATNLRAGTVSDTQKPRDLARRKAVSWNTRLGGFDCTRFSSELAR